MKGPVPAPAFFPKLTGNDVMEALDFGKAVAGRRIPGNTSLLAQCNGFPFNLREEHDVLCLRLCKNRQEAVQAGRRAKRLIAARFGPATVNRWTICASAAGRPIRGWVAVVAR